MKSVLVAAGLSVAVVPHAPGVPHVSIPPLAAAAPKAVAAPPMHEVASSSSVLRMGSRGSRVAQVQRRLRLPADGVYGLRTWLAVHYFQRTHRLHPDGQVGPATWRAMFPPPPPHRPARRPAPRPVNIGARVVALAAAQRGKPYVFGAAGPRAFDCSGLTQYVYAHAGKRIPRTTWSQYAATIHLRRGQQRPGDLIFTSSLGHVSIYAGNGMMWTAPHTGARVRLERIYDPHYLVGRVR